jgi:hypothetical protein
VGTGRVSGGASDGQSFTLGGHDPHDIHQIVRAAPRHRAGYGRFRRGESGRLLGVQRE